MTDPDTLEPVRTNEVRWRGRNLLHFSGCDYFRMARHPALRAAARSVLSGRGLNVAASRLTTGNHPIYGQLELELARWFDCESAVVLPDGYLAPVAAAQALTGDFTHALIDEASHGALVDASRMLDCPVIQFKHRDALDLAQRLQNIGQPSRIVLLTDGLFARDGSVAPLQAYLKVLPARALILLDDAHGVGILGENGRGTLEHEGVDRRRVIQCGTLSKAFGAYGGMVLGVRSLRNRILGRSRCFVGTTPLPLPLAGAALAGLRLLGSAGARRVRLRRNAGWFRAGLQEAGWECAETPGPIVRLPMCAEKVSEAVKLRLLEAGIYPPFLRYGAGSPQGAFRFVISSEHTLPQLRAALGALAAYAPAPRTGTMASKSRR